MQRSQVYKFLAAISNTLPDEEYTRQICSLFFEPNFFIQCNVPGDGDQRILEGLQLLSQFSHDHRNEGVSQLSTQLAVDWTRLFRGIKYGPPPARASAYRPYNVAALMETYFHAGLSPLSEGRFDPDYLGIQLAFVNELVSREHACWGDGDQRQVLALVDLQKEFLAQHLDWVSDYCAQAIPYASLTFYSGALIFLEGFIHLERQWLDEVIQVIRGGKP